jgi:hypothetical protein
MRYKSNVSTAKAYYTMISRITTVIKIIGAVCQLTAIREYTILTIVIVAML